MYLLICLDYWISWTWHGISMSCLQDDYKNQPPLCNRPECQRFEVQEEACQVVDLANLWHEKWWLNIFLLPPSISTAKPPSLLSKTTSKCFLVRKRCQLGSILTSLSVDLVRPWPYLQIISTPNSLFESNLTSSLAASLSVVSREMSCCSCSISFFPSVIISSCSNICSLILSIVCDCSLISSS